MDAEKYKVAALRHFQGRQVESATDCARAGRQSGHRRGVPRAAWNLRRGRHGAGSAGTGRLALRGRGRAGVFGLDGQGRDEAVARERGLPVVEYMVVTRDTIEPEAICGRLSFPMFVKPANLGSSVGISKARNCEELKAALELAGTVRPQDHHRARHRRGASSNARCWATTIPSPPSLARSCLRANSTTTKTSTCSTRPRPCSRRI